MNIVERRWRYWIACLGLLLLAVAPGCMDRDSTAAAGSIPAVKLSPDALRDKIDGVVDYTLNARQMNVRDQAAWQIVHGIEAFGRDLPIEHDGKVSSAVDYLLAGGALKGWVLRPGDKGVLSIIEAGSKTGQGHPDQWLGYMSQCGDVKAGDQLIVGGKKYHISDLMTEAQWQLFDGEEASWTLMGAVTYLPLDAKWTAKDGSKWTFERLVAMEASHKLGEGGCGGSHRLYALAIAVNRYNKETHTDPADMRGGWRAAYDKVADGLETARKYQQRDGSFSTGFFEKPAESADLGTRLYSAGHTLEFVAAAVSSGLYDNEDTADHKPYELSDPWVVAAVNRLCNEMNVARDMEPDCGTLYHAAHGLRLYRDLRFGPRRPQLAAK
ncbi:MAG TPA: hypothetical protein VHX65_14615 [Pirellulales bacterium]|nr:hypothetical protein [Pirellulales bacterium]